MRFGQRLTDRRRFANSGVTGHWSLVTNVADVATVEKLWLSTKIAFGSSGIGLS